MPPQIFSLGRKSGSLSSPWQRRSLPHSNLPLGEKHTEAPGAHSVVLYLLLSVFCRPRSFAARPGRRLDTELQMGGTGPRQLVSQCGLEFTVGIKYETNMSLHICFPLFVHPAVS